MRMVFINIPVGDIEASQKFFCEMGFGFNPKFCDSRSACFLIEENIFVILKAREHVGAAGGADTGKRSCPVAGLSLSSREEVDLLLQRALTAGGTLHEPSRQEGATYSTRFSDLDGHIWELAYIEPPL